MGHPGHTAPQHRHPGPCKLVGIGGALIRQHIIFRRHHNRGRHPAQIGSPQRRNRRVAPHILRRILAKEPPHIGRGQRQATAMHVIGVATEICIGDRIIQNLQRHHGPVRQPRTAHRGQIGPRTVAQNDHRSFGNARDFSLQNRRNRILAILQPGWKPMLGRQSITDHHHRATRPIRQTSGIGVVIIQRPQNPAATMNEHDDPDRNCLGRQHAHRNIPRPALHHPVTHQRHRRSLPQPRPPRRNLRAPLGRRPRRQRRQVFQNLQQRHDKGMKCHFASLASDQPGQID